jgi:hypothetical protein
VAPISLLPNSAFQGPLQVAWDSTSMGALKTCPRLYYYSVVLGFEPRDRSVHLTFGLLYHAALERYDHARAQGLDHEEGTRTAVRYAMWETWDAAKGRPWDSGDSYKNRYTLVRTIVWYLAKFEHDPMRTHILANGKPAVELSFRVELDYARPDGDPYLLCGHLDKLAWLGDDLYIADKKTTKSELGDRYFSSYNPDNQFSTYTFGSQIAYNQTVKGLIVDAARVLVNSSEFMRAPVMRPLGSLEEWYKDFGIYLKHAEEYAAAKHWPMNDKACGNYGGCPFRGICSKAPSVKEEWLQVSYNRRTWDPLKVRGDI